MARFSKQSKFGDLLKNKESRAVMEQFMPGCSKNPKSRLAFGITLEAMAGYAASGISDEMLDEMDKALQALG